MIAYWNWYEVGRLRTAFYNNIRVFEKISGSGWDIPKIPQKWGAQVLGGVVSFGFGKVTDNHLAGEKGGEVVVGFYKWLVETGLNAAPNAVK